MSFAYTYGGSSLRLYGTLQIKLQFEIWNQVYFQTFKMLLKIWEYPLQIFKSTTYFKFSFLIIISFFNIHV